MHELIGHGHKTGGDDAYDVNAFYIDKMGLNVSTGNRNNSGHGGFRGIKWKQTDLYDNK